MNIYSHKRIVKTHHKYCCYLTTYTGKLLPPFYIGSGQIKRIEKGYHGSVQSKKWKELYKQEIKNNPHLFSTTILRSTFTRKMSTAVELYIQRQNNVVKSTFFFNESYAIKNGMFGRDVSGKNHPLWGVGHTAKTCAKISKNHHNVKGISNPMYNKNHSAKSKKQISSTRMKVQKNGNTLASNATIQRIKKAGKHWNSFKLKIYDSENTLIYFDYFSKLQKDQPDLPINAIRKSYTKGLPISDRLGEYKTKWKKYRGWYAIKENK